MFDTPPAFGQQVAQRLFGMEIQRTQRRAKINRRVVVDRVGQQFAIPAKRAGGPEMLDFVNWIFGHDSHPGHVGRKSLIKLSIGSYGGGVNQHCAPSTHTPRCRATPAYSQPMINNRPPAKPCTKTTGAPSASFGLIGISSPVPVSARRIRTSTKPPTSGLSSVPTCGCQNKLRVRATANSAMAPMM